MLNGKTLDPNVDLRNDLVNLFGFNREEADNMAEEALYKYFDMMDDEYDGFDDEGKFDDRKCDCGSGLRFVKVDVETRSDCDTHVYSCDDCDKYVRYYDM